MNPLANEKVELANGQIRGYQIFLFIQIANPGFWRFLHYHLEASITAIKQIFNYVNPLFIRDLQEFGRDIFCGFFPLPLFSSRMGFPPYIATSFSDENEQTNKTITTVGNPS